MRSTSGQKYSLLYRLFPFLLKYRSKKLWDKAIHENRTDVFRLSDPFRVNYKY